MEDASQQTLHQHLHLKDLQFRKPAFPGERHFTFKWNDLGISELKSKFCLDVLQVHKVGLFGMMGEFNNMGTGYTVLVSLAIREFSWAGLIPYEKQSLIICWSCKHVSYSCWWSDRGLVFPAGRRQETAQIYPLMFSPPVTARMPSTDICTFSQEIQPIPSFLVLHPGVGSNFWLFRTHFPPHKPITEKLDGFYLIYSKVAFCYHLMEVSRWLAACLRGLYLQREDAQKPFLPAVSQLLLA